MPVRPASVVMLGELADFQTKAGQPFPIEFGEKPAT